MRIGHFVQGRAILVPGRWPVSNWSSWELPPRARSCQVDW